MLGWAEVAMVAVSPSQRLMSEPRLTVGAGLKTAVIVSDAEQMPMVAVMINSPELLIFNVLPASPVFQR